MFDVAYIGHYTKDTIIYPHATRLQDGGAFFYGLNAVARMGLKSAVVTNLARQDWHVVEELQQLGVHVKARESKYSTCLKLIYPTSNLDERTIEVTSLADPFTVEQVQNIDARAFIIGASLRGEVPTQVVQAIAAKGALVVLDVQGFLRILQNGTMTTDGWPDRASVLKYATILKTDAVEAKALTGEDDRYVAARKLAEYGLREVLMTHNGSVMVYHEGVFDEAPLVPKELRGRSGRGDTCTASYVSRRLTAPPSDAVVWSAALTSLKLENEGPFRRDISEVETLYQKLKQGLKS